MSFTYAEVGTTHDPDLMPSGAHRVAMRARVGSAAVFDAAADFVLTYGMQRAAGFAVTATTPRAEPGTELVLRARFFALVRVTAPTKVVYVLDEPDRRGFAYGTLPGHPESGEELFLVERIGDETWAEARAFSRPGRWYTRVGGPVVRRLQRRATLDYLESVRVAVGGT